MESIVVCVCLQKEFLIRADYKLEELRLAKNDEEYAWLEWLWAFECECTFWVYFGGIAQVSLSIVVIMGKEYGGVFKTLYPEVELVARLRPGIRQTKYWQKEYEEGGSAANVAY